MVDRARTRLVAIAAVPLHRPRRGPRHARRAAAGRIIVLFHPTKRLLLSLHQQLLTREQR